MKKGISLSKEIRAIVRTDDKSIDAYSVARRAYFLGKWIKHCGWYPVRVVRLLRRSSGRFGERLVHERVIVAGTVGQLKNDLLHYTDPDLQQYFRKLNQDSSLAAEQLRLEGKRCSAYDLLIPPAFEFLKTYILTSGFLDGMRGFILSVLSSFYVLAKYAKLWDYRDNQWRRISHERFIHMNVRHARCIMECPGHFRRGSLDRSCE